MPVMVLAMLALLMVQLQSFQSVVLVFITVPLGMIGVAVALLATGLPFGFVAMLGVIALAIMGGLAGATLLTLLFLPALYAAWFRVGEPTAAATPANSESVPMALAAE